MNKRGQFYLIAAAIIAVIVLSLSSYSVYVSKSKEPSSIKELKLDLNRESFKIVEYGIYNKKDITELLKNFSEKDVAKYFLSRTNKANIYFIYGDENNLRAVKYKEDLAGTIGTIGTEVPVEEAYVENVDVIKDPSKGRIFVQIRGKAYSFKLKEHQMFYFIIVKQQGEEEYIEDSEKIKMPIKEKP